MKKTIIIIFMVLALLMTSTIPALALGNEFTFSIPWFKGVLNNSYCDWIYVSNGSSSSSTFNELPSIDGGSIENKALSLDGSIVDISSNYTFFNYGEEYITDVTPTDGYRRLSFDCPLSITIKPNQTLKIQAVLIIKWQADTPSVYSGRYSDVRVSKRLFSKDGGIISLNDSPDFFYPNASVGTMSYSSGVYRFVPEFNGEALFTDFSWVNNTGSDVVVDYINFSYIANSSVPLMVPGYSFGFLAENVDDTVVLPSYVEENLIDIKNEILNQGEDFKKLLLEMDELQLQIDELISAQGASSSTTNNYYQTITTPSDSQKDRTAILQEAVKTAKEELAKMQEVMQSVSVPTSDAVLDATPQEVKVSIDEALDNSDVSSILEKLFANSLVVTMLLSVVSIATVGYILYGKR